MNKELSTTGIVRTISPNILIEVNKEVEKEKLRSHPVNMTVIAYGNIIHLSLVQCRTFVF